jgi:DNA replication and repair protein RecF
MFLQRFSAQGIRNLKPCNIELSPALNVFYGDNGAGKSSILEALGLLTSGRSFRTAKIDAVLSHQSPQFTVFGKTDESHRFGLGYVKAQRQKTIKINGEAVKALSDLAKCYPTQVISPESYQLIDAGPSERRKYLDWCLFHVEHHYHAVWKSYYSVLKQRNALLKGKSRQAEQELDVWDDQLVSNASRLLAFRQEIVARLGECLQLLIEDLATDFSGEVQLRYYPGYSGELKEKLKENRNLDLKSGYTRAGPHNADLRVSIGNEPAKEFLSRGQKKVLINALYLAQTLLLKNATHKDSLFIIDDFASELDVHNQEALLNTLLQQENVQIILSCLHLGSLNWLKTRYNSAHMFHVEHGSITPRLPGVVN